MKTNFMMINIVRPKAVQRSEWKKLTYVDGELWASRFHDASTTTKACHSTCCQLAIDTICFFPKGYQIRLFLPLTTTSVP